ncbi:MAG: DUF3810 domain-containing protein [Candidatus Pedobacter colombiensis]|uniref:DUF3810 domain-containing protein n=1 Tax=Candidatus Pedobacter colombiensis TaxID=3121371 RepID=A0AAJ5W5J2_9SPHI|nr:DUF3810 domain-containing protein [Pedobacter sp.]WEK18352.1 MAG: DUF3810 domain-containing protein [Pedobacter sp.]
MNTAYPPKLKQFILLLILSAMVYAFGFKYQWVEHLYAQGTYPVTSVIQRYISSFLPFALGDFLYLLLILYVIRSLYLFYKKLAQNRLKKIDWRNITLQALNFLMILYLVFKILWGLNYSRLPIARQLDISDEKYTTPQLVSLGEYFINRLNSLQQIKKESYNIQQLREKAKEAYNGMQQKNAFFTYKSQAVKPVLNSWIITKIGIEGYYSPLSGEANVNMCLPGTSLPFVTCHEIAHQLGVAREDEANLVGYLVASNSKEPYFRYSATYEMLKNILFEIRIKSPEDYERLYTTINPITINDLKADRNFWQKYNSDMFAYMDVAFDRFLKLNNQPKGTESYQDIVLWLYNIHKKELNN